MCMNFRFGIFTLFGTKPNEMTLCSSGRPKRRAAAAAWPPAQNASPPPSAYKRVVDSDSDSGEDHTNTGRKRGAAWANLQGIISDDGESD